MALLQPVNNNAQSLYCCCGGVHSQHQSGFSYILCLINYKKELFPIACLIDEFKMLAKIRVNPRPIGRGYKREPRSGSNHACLGSAHILAEFQLSHPLHYKQ
ncbi:MAG: hypothetical protein OIF57_13970, partial [Marinobacterium sp.]|nr:hypothetical protein [Marinobacterium sp.]